MKKNTEDEENRAKSSTEKSSFQIECTKYTDEIVN